MPKGVGGSFFNSEAFGDRMQGKFSRETLLPLNFNS